MAQHGPDWPLDTPLDQWPDRVAVPPIAPHRGAGATFFARLRPPGSKSLTNRALLLAALADGTSAIRGALVGAEDTERMIAALGALGVGIDRLPDGELRVRGVAGRWAPASAVTLELGNAGTATRFLAAAAMLARAPVLIDGDARMRERPIAELVNSLRQLGAAVAHTGREGVPPVRVSPPPELITGARLAVPTTESSQFITALLLIAPWLPGGLTLTLDGKITSRSYIVMTLGMLDALGARVRTSDDLRVIRVAGASAQRPGLAPFSYQVEPDASSATYFWGAAALFSGAVCRVEGIDARSLQGDAQFADLLGRMGATVIREEATAQAPASIGIRGPAHLNPIMADLSQMPDAAVTLGAIACFAPGRSILRGLRTLRVKESDRIAALQAELAKVGVKVETSVLGDPDAITIFPPLGGIDCSPTCPPVEFETYNDHRMAMALSLVGLRRPNVTVCNPRCVGKTFPGFWRELASLY
jgi:3-phosphoshikimate 1-carboxyvinyltransferase